MKSLAIVYATASQDGLVIVYALYHTADNGITIISPDIVYTTASPDRHAVLYTLYHADDEITKSKQIVTAVLWYFICSSVSR